MAARHYAMFYKGKEINDMSADELRDALVDTSKRLAEFCGAEHERLTGDIDRVKRNRIWKLDPKR